MREMPQDVVAALILGGDAFCLEQRHRIEPSDLPAAGEHARDQLTRPIEDVISEAQLGEALFGARDRARGEQRKHPSHVFGHRQMERATHQPRANDAALGDGELDV